jgi:poly(3-hydroxybutyrate) depolymerase
MNDTSDLPDLPRYTLSERTIPASADDSEEPIVIGHPEDLSAHDSDHPLPLLVGLHSWSTHRYNAGENMAGHAAAEGWLSLYPQFRGPNITSNARVTEAGGSIAAQHDIVDAVEHMIAELPVDEGRIYLMGGSGGGHMATLMAGKYPDLWAAVSAWVPITSLQEWWEQCANYRDHVEAVCGGSPGSGAGADWEYIRRSPRTFITNAAHTPLQMCHGQMDGTIPVDQSWQTFRRLNCLPGHKTVFRSDSTGHATDFAAGVRWLKKHVRSDDAPRRMQLFTDEPKWFFWCHIAPASDDELAEVEAGVEGEGDERILRVRSIGAQKITINLPGLPGDEAAGTASDTLEIVPGDPAAPFERVVKISEM